MLGDKWVWSLKAARSAKHFLLQFISNFAVNHPPETEIAGIWECPSPARLLTKKREFKNLSTCSPNLETARYWYFCLGFGFNTTNKSYSWHFTTGSLILLPQIPHRIVPSKHSAIMERKLSREGCVRLANVDYLSIQNIHSFAGQKGGMEYYKQWIHSGKAIA